MVKMKREDMLSEMRNALKKSGIRKAYLFGSFARKEKRYADIDIAIEPPRNFSLLDMAGVALELEDSLGKKIDLVTLRSLNPRLKAHIEKDMTAIV